MALAISDGEVFNDLNPWVTNIIKDSGTGIIYEVLWNDIDVYTEETTNPISLVNLIDDVTGIYYQIFIYHNQAFIVPVKDNTGQSYYSDDCFISAGGTIILNIVRNSTEVTTIDNVSVNILDKNNLEYLYLDIGITEIKENMFNVNFIMPLKGEYLVIVNVMNTTFLMKSLSVNQYTYSNLISRVQEVKDEKFIGYI